jgi:transposase
MRWVGRSVGELFFYVDLEKRVSAKHPLRLVRDVVNDVLEALDGDFTKVYADSGRPSIALERLLRALLLHAFYTIRSERQLIACGERDQNKEGGGGDRSNVIESQTT